MRVRRAHIIRRIISIGVLLSALLLISQVCVVRWNRSESLPGKMFIGVVGNRYPHLGDMVSFDHAMYPAPLAKVVVGVAGDPVEMRHGRIYVRGIDRGDVLPRSPFSGNPLHPTESGIIPSGYVYVWAPHPHSFDSRYAHVGLIHVSQIKERLWRVF